MNSSKRNKREKPKLKHRSGTNQLALTVAKTNLIHPYVIHFQITVYRILQLFKREVNVRFLLNTTDIYLENISFVTYSIKRPVQSTMIIKVVLNILDGLQVYCVVFRNTIVLSIGISSFN